MSVDLNRLKTMSKDELIDIARQVNAPHHHKNSVETLVTNIINKVTEPSVTQPHNPVAASPAPKEPVFITQEEAENAIAPIKARYKALSTSYDEATRSCTLRYNDGRYRHAETINLSCSLAKLVRKATEIGRGPLVLRGHKQEEWGTIGGNNPKNSYTETVLAG